MGGRRPSPCSRRSGSLSRSPFDSAPWTSLSLSLVHSIAVPKPDGPLSAVVVSGGKQYRVAPGDHILVDRLAAEPGSSLKLDRVLLFTNGDDFRIGTPAIDGLDVEVKGSAHPR